jgi:serine/threonine protein kinase
MNNSVTYNGLPLGEPVPFPNPMIRPCQKVTVNVRLEDGTIEQHIALTTNSGHIYELGEIIRNAIFGRVEYGIELEAIPNSNNEYRRTENEVAIKIFLRERLRQLQGRTQENPLMEITALQFIGSQHPALIGQIECSMDNENIYSIMRFFSGGELFDRISATGEVLTESDARHFFQILLSAMERLQSVGIAHRDLSLENILCGADHHQYAVIDFGMCLRLSAHPTLPNIFLPIRRQPVCGKRNYIAPEVLRQDEYFHPFAVDIWALGIILFIVLTGVPPMDLASINDERYSMICEQRLGEMITTWGYTLSNEVIDLIQRILHPDPLQRLTLQQIIDHPWMHMIMEEDED